MGHHRPASETQFGCRFAGGPRWPNIECWLGSFVVLQGNRTSIAKKPYSFAIFEGGGGVGTLCSPSGSAKAISVDAHQTVPVFQLSMIFQYLKLITLLCTSWCIKQAFLYGFASVRAITYSRKLDIVDIPNGRITILMLTQSQWDGRFFFILKWQLFEIQRLL